MSNDNSQTNGSSRRTFLRSTGVTLSGAALAPLASGASARGPPESDAHVAKGRFGEGVSTERIEEVREAALAEFNARGGDLEAAPARSTPDPEDGTVVSYAYRIDENGVPQQYTGIAGDHESVGHLHSRAADRAAIFEGSTAAERSDALAGEGSNGVTAQAGSWDTILHDEADYCEDPYGCVTNNFNLNELQNDGDYAQDAYAIKHIFAMEPGTQKYGSSWENNLGRPMHDWRQNNMGGEDLHEWDPLGTHDGSQSIDVSVGTTGASLGWSYTQPAVTTTDKSSPSSNYALWHEGFDTSNARQNTNGMKPGSSAWLDQQPSGSGYYDLLDLVADGEFQDSSWHSSDTYYLKHTFHIDVYY